LRREGVSRAELSVTFVSDAGIARLHGEYLGLAEVTDVLAFALHGEGEKPLGDVYIGHSQALRQAEEVGARPDEEMARLAVHGALHVLGYDHPKGARRQDCEMFRVQEEVMSGLGEHRDQAAHVPPGARGEGS
jgi:probable rRNA maturation factor